MLSEGGSRFTRWPGSSSENVAEDVVHAGGRRGAGQRSAWSSVSVQSWGHFPFGA
jgi:hypothetical protein